MLVGWIRTSTRYTPRYFFPLPLSSSLVFWFHIMKLMTCQLTEVRRFFCGVHVCDKSKHLWMCVCTCKGSFKYAFGCLCRRVCIVGGIFCVNEILRSKWRWPEDPNVELLLPFLTQGTCYKLLTLTQLFAYFLPIYLSATRLPRHTKPLHHLNTQTLKRGNQPMFPSTEPRVRWRNRRREACWLKPYTLLLSCYPPRTSQRWIRIT